MPPVLPNSLARLRSFARSPRSTGRKCEMCSACLADEHEHAVELTTGRIICCCHACAVLFRNPATARFRTVSRDIVSLPDFQLSDAQWENLAIPINLAFLFESTRTHGPVAVYPSPAGGTESHPMQDAWDDIRARNRVLADFVPDIEALLVNRMQGTRQYFRVPIDECYKLVGIVRANWRGFTGGVALWRTMDLFFRDLQSRARR